MKEFKVFLTVSLTMALVHTEGNAQYGTSNYYGQRNPLATYNCPGKNMFWLAAIAQWNCQCLPSCCSGLESQVQHLRFFQFIHYKYYICHLNCNVKRMKTNKKRPGLVHKGHFLDYVCNKPELV